MAGRLDATRREGAVIDAILASCWGLSLDAPGAPRVTWGQPDPAHGLPRAARLRRWAQPLGGSRARSSPSMRGRFGTHLVTNPDRMEAALRGAGDPDHRPQDLGARRPRADPRDAASTGDV